MGNVKIVGKICGKGGKEASSGEYVWEWKNVGSGKSVWLWEEGRIMGKFLDMNIDNVFGNDIVP